MKLRINIDRFQEYALSVFIVVFMSQRSFMSLNGYMFGHDSAMYRQLQLIIVAFLILSFLTSCLVCARRLRKWTVVLYFFVLLLFGFTYIFADGAKDVIKNEKLFSNVFFYGLTGMILMQMVEDYTAFLKTLRFTGYVVVIYSTAIVLFGSIGSGYMGFSYAILLYIITLLYCGLFQKNNLSLLFGFVGTIVNIFGGTRGSLLCLFALLVAFLLFSKRWKLMVLLLCLSVVLALNYNRILHYTSDILGLLEVDSRIIEAILGTKMSSLSDANGRISILNVSLNLICENWLLGYGFLGERAYINSGIWWFTTNGYAHNFVIEILLQFGLIVGSAILLMLIYRLVYFIRRFENNSRCGIIMIFICYCVHLAVSRSYTTTFEFWCLIGLLWLFPHRINKESQCVT